MGIDKIPGLEQCRNWKHGSNKGVSQQYNCPYACSGDSPDSRHFNRYEIANEYRNIHQNYGNNGPGHYIFALFINQMTQIERNSNLKPNWQYRCRIPSKDKSNYQSEDSNNNPHISYYENPNEDLKYAKWTGTDWQIEVVDSDGEVGTYTSIALDSNDLPHIIYYDETDGNLKLASRLPVGNNPPIADANGPYTGNEGETIILDGSGSYDLDGSIILYEWDLDNDGEYDDATGETISSSWFDDGVYTIALIVTDDDSDTDTDVSAIIVNDLEPTAEFTWTPKQQNEG